MLPPRQYLVGRYHTVRLRSNWVSCRPRTALGQDGGSTPGHPRAPPYMYILLRIRARPACDQPLHSNGDRVAHRRTIQSWPFWDYRQNPATGRDLTPPLLVRGLSVRDRVNRPASTYLWVPTQTLRRGEGPRLRPTPDTNRLRGSFRVQG